MSNQLKTDDNINKYNSRGEKDGEWKDWCDDGQLYYQRFWKNGKKHGECKDWWYNGQIKSQQFWVNGKIEGEWKSWYENGQLSSYTFWKNWRRDGESKKWREDGQLMSQEFWFEGIRYPRGLLPKLQRKVRQKILYRKFKDLITSRGFLEAWWDPESFGGWWHKKRMLKELENI